MLERLLDGLGKNKSTIVAFVVGALIANRISGSMVDKFLAHNGEGAAQAEPWKSYVDTRLMDMDEKSSLRNTGATALVEALSKKVDAQGAALSTRLDANTAAIKTLADRIYDLARSRRASYALGWEISR